MTGLRVTGGVLRGRRVPLPPEQRQVRPTSERARQAYFNIVADRVEGSRFLDLFAGSGIFSFEAVSRGALSALAVDQSRRNTRAIESLARSLALPIAAVNADVLRALAELAQPFDLAYADPPYAYERYADLLAALGKLSLPPGALLAIEHRRRTNPFPDPPLTLEFWRRAEYGEVSISFFIRTDSEPTSSLPRPLQ